MQIAMYDLAGFIHYGYFCSASSSPLILRGAPDYNIDNVSELTRQALQVTARKRLAQGPYLTTRVGFEPATLRRQGTETTTDPQFQCNSIIFELHMKMNSHSNIFNKLRDKRKQ